jgi:hypothetical protein
VSMTCHNDKKVFRTTNSGALCGGPPALFLLVERLPDKKYWNSQSIRVKYVKVEYLCDLGGLANGLNWMDTVRICPIRIYAKP